MGKKTGPKPKGIAARFWPKVRKVANGCWEWTSSRTHYGYGQLTIVVDRDGKRIVRTEKAHRLSWQLHHGDIPPGMWVLHHCDNRPCVNPDHLFLGTAEDNAADMVAKGRQQRRERHWNAKLTFSDVRTINRLSGKFTRALAKRFGVTARRIREITGGKAWDDEPGSTKVHRSDSPERTGSKGT